MIGLNWSCRFKDLDSISLKWLEFPLILGILEISVTNWNAGFNQTYCPGYFEISNWCWNRSDPRRNILKVMKLSVLVMWLQVHPRERNYTVCYASFTTFMICTMAIATRLPFDYSNQESNAPPTETDKISPTVHRLKCPIYCCTLVECAEIWSSTTV